MAGNKNSGRKKMEEELRVYRESVKKITLEEIAASKIYGHLTKHTDEEDRQGLKEIAMPVYLKSKADKTENKHDIKIEISKEIADKNNLSSDGST